MQGITSIQVCHDLAIAVVLAQVIKSDKEKVDLNRVSKLYDSAMEYLMEFREV